jgi:hypothetical protein
MTKRLTPSQAIKQACRYCLNTSKISGSTGCNSSSCALNSATLTSLKRIKKNCIDCVPEQNIYGVKVCKGQVLNPEQHRCPLYPYRLGHNPARQGIGQGREDMANLRSKKLAHGPFCDAGGD